MGNVGGAGMKSDFVEFCFILGKYGIPPHYTVLKTCN